MNHLSDEKRQFLDYLFFVAPQTGDVSETSVISKKYPKEDNEESSLPNDVAYFCQPEGTYIEKFYGGSAVMKDSSFVFTLTDKDTSSTRYGVCHNFYVRKNPSDSTKDKLVSICVLTCHQFISGFRTVLATLKKITDSADRCCRERSTSCLEIWDYFTRSEMQLCDFPGIVQEYIQIIENWISMLLDSPVPEAGKSILNLQLLPDIHSSIHFALPDPTRLTLIDFPLHLPLELLGVNQCLKVLTCILLEHKVLVLSRDYNALTMSVLALVSMLYPLEYMFPVIPLLPCLMPSSEQILLAPTPFVIGIPASFVLLKKINLPQDVWVVDLDTNKIYQPKNEPDLPRLPELETTQLKSHLFQALKAMGSEDNYTAVENIENTRGSVKESYIYGNDVECVDVATRVAMIRFFDSPGVLRGAHKHMRTLRLYPRPVVAFQADCFLQSIELDNEGPMQENSFISLLSRTQAVEYLGEWSLSPSNVAFMRIQNGIWDPALIGDKPKWFAGQMESVNYNIASVPMLDQILKNADRIEAGDLLSPADLEFKRPVTSGFHERPENLALTRTRPPVSRGQSIQMMRSTSNSSVASSHKSSNSPMLRRTSQNEASNIPVGLSERQNEIRSLQQAKLQARQKRRLEITQDAELIREAAREALDGNGVSWIRLRKIKKLMESESWRLYMLSRLNQLTQREENTVYVESVEISPKAFKGISDLLKAVESGLESNFKEKKGNGGLSSVFFLMEIGHTHYCTKEEIQSPRQSLSESFSSFDNTVKAARIVAQGALTQINRQISQHKISELRLSSGSTTSEPTSIGIRRELKYRAGRMIEVETDEDDNEVRVYLYEALSREETAIWKKAQLWENAFLDVVSLERDALGMEHGPTDMIVRYRNLATAEKRRLENDEDQLLVTVLYNMSAFMIMMDVNPKLIRRKVRRLLGKSHIGLQQDKEIQRLLDSCEELHGNSADLKPLGSRHIRKQSFVVHAGTSAAGEVLFLEVCTDALILRNGMGTICERWWHEKLINMTFCPKTKVLCLWRRNGQETQLSKFYTKKCRELHHCLQEATQNSAARRHRPEIGGDFPVTDARTNKDGSLRVSLDGIIIKFEKSKMFLDIRHIKKCNTVKGVFIMEQIKPDTDEIIIHKFKSPISAEICYAVLCLFRYKTHYVNYIFEFS
ncbi:unnamed protein product [Oikopleura dioica]|uniref:MAP kinase-activating death domain protein n=1 Tax=Oikopleura dioica TaxID=34765 RepID=E4X704_OIKDI|nr:unnamed protein product [Oikopleura dioica]